MVKKMIITSIISISMLLGSAVFVPIAVSAAVDPACDTSASFLGFPTWYKYLDIGPGETGPCEIQVPKTPSGDTDLQKAITPVAMAVFEIVLRIAGLAAVGFMIFGGFQYLMSQGDPDSTKGAKSTILNAVIGLAISISAVTIVNLIGKNI